jgi:hypothetical protein
MPKAVMPQRIHSPRFAVRLPRRLPFLAFALLLLLSGCDSGGGTPERIIGEWRGAFTQDNISYTVFLSLEQTSPSDVRGTGTIDSSQGTIQVSASGTYAHPEVTLSLQLQSQRPATLEGTVSEDRSTIDARLLGSEFSGATFTLERQ